MKPGSVPRQIRCSPCLGKCNLRVASDLRHNSTKGSVYQMRWNLFGYISLVPIRFSFYAKRRSNLARASEDAEKTFNRDNAIEEWSKLNSLATNTLPLGLDVPAHLVSHPTNTWLASYRAAIQRNFCDLLARWIFIKFLAISCGFNVPEWGTSISVHFATSQ